MDCKNCLGCNRLETNYGSIIKGCKDAILDYTGTYISYSNHYTKVKQIDIQNMLKKPK